MPARRCGAHEGGRVRPLLRRLAVLVPVAALAVALGFTPVAASPVPYPEPTVTPGVEGRITGTLTGPDGPVAGASVSASSSTAPYGSGRTAADGTFTID